MPEIDDYADDETQLVINTVDGPQGAAPADDEQDDAGQNSGPEVKTRGSMMDQGQA